MVLLFSSLFSNQPIDQARANKSSRTRTNEPTAIKAISQAESSLPTLNTEEFSKKKN